MHNALATLASERALWGSQGGGGGGQEKNPIPRALQRTCSQTIVAQLSRTLHM